MTKPSRSLEKGRDTPSGGSLVPESAESRPKRIIISGFTEQSAPSEMAASLSPRRIASTPSWMAVAPEAQAVVSEIGAPFEPIVSAMPSAMKPSRVW